MAKDEVKKAEAPAAPAAEKLFTQEDMQSAVKSIAKSMVEEMLPAMAAMANVRAGQAAPVSNSKLPPQAVCQDCRQLQVACRREHVKMVVFPNRYPEYADWFQGAIINGIRYLSNDGVHEVLVPKDAVGGISKMIQDYEDNERITRIGRTKNHNSGSVGAPVPAAVGWR